MTRRLRPPAAIPPGFVLGADIDISSWRGREIVADVDGNIECFVGYRRSKQPFDLPYYAPSVALHDADGRRSYRFVELRRGMLTNSRFLRDDGHYQVRVDRSLVLPSGADTIFGVFERQTGEEDVDLTRRLFGGTRDDIESVASALASVMGRGYREIFRLPRVTFSRTRSNCCDLAGCLIPRDFPYLAFEDSQSDWGHVSLYGFYRLLSLLCPIGKNSAIGRALLEAGISEDVLKLLVENAAQYGSPLPWPEYGE